MVQGYLLGFLIIISASFFIARSFKTSIAKVLPFYLLAFSLIEYLFAMLGQLLLGYIVIIACSIIPTTIILIKNRKNLKQELKLLREPSFILICAVFLLLGIINFGRGFHAWDDFMHWGPFAKETYRNLELYNSESSLIEVHRDYPPIITLYEVFWQIVSGKFNESMLFVSLQFLQISFFFPFIDKLKWQKTTKYKFRFTGLVIALALAPAIMSLGDDYFFVTIMTDTVLGMLFALSLAEIFEAKKVDCSLFAKLVLIFSFTILLKQIALVFILIGVVCLIAKIVCEKQNSKPKLIIISMMLLLMPLLLSMAWSKRIESLGIEGQFQTSELISGSLDLVKNGMAGLAGWQVETATNFVKAYLFDNKLILGLSYFKLTILFAAIGAVIAIKNKSKRKLIIATISIITLASTGYALVMMLLYIFCFGEVEGPILASYDRYLGTFWYAILVVMFCDVLSMIQEKDLAKLPNLGIIAILVYVLFTSPASIYLTLDRTYDSKTYNEDLQLISSNVPENEKVYIISQGTNGSHNVRLKYLLNPIETNPTYGSAFIFGEKDSGSPWVSDQSKEEFAKNLEDYGYVYVYISDDYLVENYQSLFDSPLKSGQLYKNVDGKLKLVGEKK